MLKYVYNCITKHFYVLLYQTLHMIVWPTGKKVLTYNYIIIISTYELLHLMKVIVFVYIDMKLYEYAITLSVYSIYCSKLLLHQTLTINI